MKKEFRDIKEYMKLSREERRSHLDLQEECIEIGGDSRLFRGLLAHFLKTTIGTRDIYVCHACNNSDCSNPTHLYWGTPKDNWQDAKESGTWENVHSRMLKKHGEKKTSEILSSNASKAGKAGGGWNALTDQQLLAWKQAIKEADLSHFGWVSKLSSCMNCSHTHVRRIIKKYFPEIKAFQRKTRTKHVTKV
jgi:hypothetical protein